MTDISSLIEPLKKLSNIVPLEPRMEYLNKESGRYIQLSNHWVSNEGNWIKEIVDILEQIPDLNPYKQGSIRRSPSGGGSVKLDYVAHWLLAQAKNREPAEVVNQLREFIESDSVPMSLIIALWGLHPKIPIDLGDDISLIPIETLQPSEVIDQLIGIKDTPHTGGDSFHKPRPKAALKWDFIHTPILETDSGTPPVKTKLEKMKEIVRCLCLVNNTAVCEIAQWYQCDVITPLIGGVQGWGGQTVEPIFSKVIDPVDYNQDVIRSIVKKFLDFPESEKSKLYIPLSRLNVALRRSDSHPDESIDIALETGIATEVLLDPKEKRISKEIREKGTYLLGGSSNQRCINYERFRMLYKLRSEVAHNGKLNSSYEFNGTQVPTADLLKQGKLLCAELIRTILNNGTFINDWEENYWDEGN